jgi:hypothetical protein
MEKRYPIILADRELLKKVCRSIDIPICDRDQPINILLIKGRDV